MQWLSSSVMAEKYDLSRESLNTFAFNNRESVYIKKDGDNNLFNETLLNERLMFRKRMWLAAHDYYYFLQEEAGLKVAEQAALLSHDIDAISRNSWKQYLYYDLWSNLYDYNILMVDKSFKRLSLYCEWCEDAIVKIGVKMKQKRWDISCL